jgi:hypothetical protein
MAIRCSKCNLYCPNHEVRNGVCEDCYEGSESTSSEDEYTSPKIKNAIIQCIVHLIIAY